MITRVTTDRAHVRDIDATVDELGRRAQFRGPIEQLSTTASLMIVPGTDDIQLFSRLTSSYNLRTQTIPSSIQPHVRNESTTHLAALQRFALIGGP
jgi:hypothetical protein